MSAGDGAECISFINQHCRITKDSIGGKRGELIQLRPWQQLQIYRLLARNLDTGLYKHRQGLYGLPRKNAKTTKGSAIALWFADTSRGGGEVYCCAGDKDQAKIAYLAAKQMVEMDPDLSARVKPYRDELVWPETDTVFKVLSSEAFTKEGLNPTFVLFDEVHVQPDSELWDVMALAMGAREEPMMLGITTAGDPIDRYGNDSLGFTLYEYGCQVAAGETQDPTFFFSWWEPQPPQPIRHPDGTVEQPPVDHRDPKVWADANPGLGDLVSLADFESTVNRTHEAEFKKKRCNMWVAGQTAAVPGGYWHRLADMTRHNEAETVRSSSGHDVPLDALNDSVVFLDGSWSGDSTGMVGCTRDGHLFVITHHEKTKNDGPDWRVPVTSVEDDVRLCLDHGARLCLFDPFRWQRSAAVLNEEGYPMIEWHTSSLDRIVPAWTEFYKAIVDEELSHDGDLAMSRHIENIVLKTDNKGARPVKHSKGSVRHIDLGICAVGAFNNRDVEIETPRRAKLWSMT